MPSLSSLLFSSNNNNSKSSADSCCNCGCHSTTSPTLTESHESSTLIFTPTKWFPRIRRRSSSASTNSNSLSYEVSSPSASCKSSASNSRRVSLEYITEEEDKQIEEFQQLYKFSIDELDYATESQGSIYYHGDLVSATEAVDNCVEHFRQLVQTLNPSRSLIFQQEWTNLLFDTRLRLDSLPFVSSE